MITLRGVLAILLLFGVYLLALVGIAVSAAFIVASALAVQNYAQHGTGTTIGNIVPFLVGSVASLVAVVGALFSVNQAAEDADSVPVTESDAPELWEFVRTVAAEAGIRPPDELRLTGEVNASVSEDSRLLGLLPGRRRLHLGLPLLAELSANELRALLGHEFGHYIGWHTRVGVVVHRGYLALDRLQHNLTAVDTRVSPAGIFRIMFAGYTRLYARISFAVRRRQEFEADAVAARIAGPEAVARALRSLAPIGAHWQLFVQNYLQRTAAVGYAPEDPLAMFVAMLSDEHRRAAMDRLKAADPEPEQHNPYASHPSTADRLARLAAMSADAPTRPREPEPSAWRYPGRQMLTHLLPGREVEALSSARWLDRAAGLGAPTAAARMLLDVTGPNATLGTVLDTLEAGEAGRLAARFDAEDPYRALARLCEALHGLVGHYLVESGSARWRLSWTGTSDLVVSELRPDGVHVLPFSELNTLVFDAVDHRSGVDRLRLHLASLNVDPRRRHVAETERSTSIEVDTEPLRREQARRVRAFVFSGVMAAAVIGIFVYAEATPKEPPHIAGTLRPSITLPTLPTPFQFYTTGALLPPSLIYPTRPTLDLTAPAPITVAPGDSLYQLARCHGTTVADLQHLNGLGDSTDLKVGQTLLVPNAFLACR